MFHCLLVLIDSKHVVSISGVIWLSVFHSKVATFIKFFSLYNFTNEWHETDRTLKILGIDHGNVRIGIAISDESGSLARPFGILTHVSRAEDAKQVAQIALDEDCGMIVVGVPYDSEGMEGHRARSVLRFARALEEVSTIPVRSWDESFSTQNVIATSVRMNKRQRTRRKALDDLAAAEILQSFLDQNVKLTGNNNV